MINIEDNRSCCGCEACAQICPKHCISLKEDMEGFLYPSINHTECINCNACEQTCPMLTPYDSRKPIRQIAAVNPDENIRRQSSSGGIFTMLAVKVIEMGGVVFGVRFDEYWQVVFDYTETIGGLSAFRGSKYLQARVGDAYNKAKSFLKEGRYVMFSAAPCQIAALRHYLKKDYENLLCVDFVCHGVPSPKVWGMYLNEVTQNALKAINDIQFRNKKQGWKRFNFDLTFDKDGQHYSISSWHRKNHFMRIFLNDVILRPSCYDCKAKGGRSGSDITMADFWGIDKIYPQIDDDKGTSLVLLNTSKGKQFVDGLNIKRWETTYENVVKHNSAIENSAKEHPKRAYFFSKLNENQSVTTLIEDVLRLPLKTRIKQHVRLLLGKIKRLIRTAGGGILQIKKPVIS